MAEIPIERKSSKAWLWVLLALAGLAFLAWYIINSRVVETPATTAAAGEVAPAAGVVDAGAGADAPAAANPGLNAPGGAVTGAPVAAFLTWADSTQARTAAAPDHDFVATGIERLSGAIADLAAPARDSIAGNALAEQVGALNRLAVQVKEDREALTHANVVHAAFESSAKLLGDLQQRRFPAAAGTVADVRAAAEAIDRNRPLLDQKAQMERFFTQAAAAVRAMST